MTAGGTTPGVSSGSAFGGSSDREPRVRVGGAALILTVIGTAIIAAAIAAWVTQRVVAPVAPGTPEAAASASTPEAGAPAASPPDPVRSSLLGSLVAALVTVPVLIAIQPWKVRAAGNWAVLWLGSTVGRLLITPVVGLLVYSATPVRTDVFLLSLAGTYLACLAAEVAVSARGVARALPAAEAEIRRDSASR